MKADRLTLTLRLRPGLPRPHTLVAEALLFFSVLFAVQGGKPTASETVDIGSRLELFVDEYLIDSMSGVSLQLHRPQLSEPVLNSLGISIK